MILLNIDDTDSYLGRIGLPIKLLIQAIAVLICCGFIKLSWDGFVGNTSSFKKLLIRSKAAQASEHNAISSSKIWKNSSS